MARVFILWLVFGHIVFQAWDKQVQRDCLIYARPLASLAATILWPWPLAAILTGRPAQCREPFVEEVR